MPEDPRPASAPTEKDEGPAEALFERFLAQLEDGGQADFDAFAAKHPEHARELAALWADWRQVEATLDRALPGSVGEESFFRATLTSRTAEAARRDGRAAARLRVRPGQQVGDFRLVRVLGSGGMGQVWEAEQLSLGGRRVALKLLRPGRGGDGRAARLDAEARAGGRVAHAGIVAVYSAGEIEGCPYIAQELVGSGFTLADFLAQARALPRLPPEYDRNVAKLFAEVADALHAAHEAGILHRDLKPQNILIGPDDRPKVSDFGLAHVAAEAGSARPGLLGTYPYMSPEQAGGRDVAIDRRSDVFSLGAVLYEALTLRRAFEGDDAPRILQRIQEEDPPPARSIRSGVPWELAVIAGKALQKARGDRYASMRELADDLRRYLRNEPILARPEGLLGRAVKWSRRHPGKSTALLLGGAALLAISALLVREVELRRRAEDARERADQAARVADQRAEQVLQSGYLANVLAAALQLQQDDHTEARARLGQCPADRRGFEWHHLALSADLAVRHLRTGDGDELPGLALARGGELVAGATRGGRLVLWEGDGEPAVLLRHSRALSAVALDEAGDLLVAGGEDGAVLAGPPREVVEVARHAAAVTAVAVSSDGTRLASASADGTVRLLDRDGARPVVVPAGAGAAIVSLALSADGRRLVTGSQYGAVEVWDATDGDHRLTVVGSGGDQVVVATDATGALVATGWRDGSVDVWDGESGELLARAATAHEFAVTALALPGEARWLATASAEDDSLHLWDVPPRPNGPAAAASGVEVLAGGAPLPARPVPELRHAGRLTGATGRLRSLAASRDGAVVAAGTSAGTCSVWDGRTRGAVLTLPAPSRLVTSLAAAADGRRFVSASLYEGVLRVWDGHTGRVTALLSGHEVGVIGVAMSGDGERIASASYDDTLRVWDARTARATLVRREPGVSALAMDGPGARVAVGGLDGGVRLREAATGALLVAREGLRGRVPSLALSADGQVLLAADADGTVLLWRGEEPPLRLREGTGFDDGLVALSHDGTTAAWASLHEDRTVVWDSRSGELLSVLAGNRNGITALALSGDGRRAVSASARDDTLRVWDSRSGDVLAVLGGHAQPVTALVLTADGRRLLSAARDRTLVVRESRLDDARALWAALAGRP